MSRATIRYLWIFEHGFHTRLADGMVASQNSEGRWTLWKDGKKLVGRWDDADKAKHYADTKRPPRKESEE